MDYLHYSTQRESDSRPMPPIDAFAPVYRPASETVATYLLSRPPTLLGTNRQEQHGVYVQDQIRSGPWSVALAVRRNRMRNSGNADMGLGNPANPRDSGPPVQSKTLYSAGVLYLTKHGLAPYASYSTDSAPAQAQAEPSDRTPYLPELSRQFEIGLKYTPPGMDALFTLSAFDLRRNNAMSPDRAIGGLMRPIGEVRARGTELEARASLTPQLKMIASLTLLDATVTRAENPADLGKQPTRTARKTAALWLDHRFTDPALHGWSLGGGIRYVGKVPADIENIFFNPAYTLVDAALRYERGPYSFALNATNLFDRRYVAGLGQYFGQGRTLQAKATYRW